MNPIPPEALRRLVQAASEINYAVSPTPSGKALVDAMETLLEAVDAYRSACTAEAAGNG